MYLTSLENGPRTWQSNKTPAGSGAWREVKNRLHTLLYYAKLMISPSRGKKKYATSHLLDWLRIGMGSKYFHTVDGRNLAPVDMVNVPL